MTANAPPWVAVIGVSILTSVLIGFSAWASHTVWARFETFEKRLTRLENIDEAKKVLEMLQNLKREQAISDPEE